MMLEEAQELVEELEKAFVTDDLTQVVGEVADILYLSLKMCRELGINADQLIEMKILRNEMKYHGHTDGKEAKEDWEKKGGDDVFYRSFLDYLANLSN